MHALPVPARIVHDALTTQRPAKVLNHMPVQFNEKETPMIDLDAPTHTDEHRKGPKRVLVAGLLAAAAVAAIAIVATLTTLRVQPRRPRSTACASRSPVGADATGRILGP